MPEPSADRPRIPASYGVPRRRASLLPWSHAVERLMAARIYWLATARKDGQPHAMPVEGLWLDGRLYFGGGAETRWSRNLEENPRAAVHLESGSDVVIVKGNVVRLTDPDVDLARRLSAASEEKYGMRPPDPYPPVWILEPRVAFAWTPTFVNPTRWRFGEG
jgi:nitroimidazol reductase NimA-like FMN-containing flavoprotein (pyridoxamine 5'-phosphate oxidase superfamily)